MKALKNLFVQVMRNEEGATMIEYALLAALISIVAIAAITAVGNKVDSTFDTVDSKLTPAGSGTPSGT